MPISLNAAKDRERKEYLAASPVVFENGAADTGEE
jgi:hypothetical protein